VTTEKAWGEGFFPRIWKGHLKPMT
jgi:hypothetical protein